MVARIEEIRTSDRWYAVMVDGRKVGTIELDATRWAAHATRRPVQWFHTREAARQYVVAVATDQAAPLADRWARALERAIAAGIDPVQVGGLESTWAVPSATREDVCYLVTSGADGTPAGGCTCTAGNRGDAVCLHRAAVRACLGILALPESPEPVAPAAACDQCHGRGEVDCGYYHWTTRDWVSVMRPCGRCAGADRRDQPAA